MGVTTMDNRSYYHHDDLVTDYSVSITNGVLQRNQTDEKNANLLYNVLITLFGAIIALSNLAVVISSGLSVKNSKKPKLIHLLLGNIALGDFFAGIVVIFGQIFPVHLRNQQICAAQLGLVLTSTLVTIYSIGIIGVDRFLYIYYGYQHQHGLYFKIIPSSIVLVWIFSLVIGFLPLMGWSRDTTNEQTCCFVVLVPETFVLIVAILYFVPLLIIVFLYSAVIYQAGKKVSLQSLLVNKPVPKSVQKRKFQMDKTKTTHDSTYTGQSRNFLSRMFLMKFSTAVNVSKRWKAVKVVGFSAANFLFTWFPYTVVSLYYMSICDDDSSKKCRSLSLVLASPLVMLGFVNSLVSPIIYAWWHKGFNRYIKRRISTFRLRNPSHNKRVVPNACSNATMTTILENSNERISSV